MHKFVFGVKLFASNLEKNSWKFSVVQLLPYHFYSSRATFLTQRRGVHDNNVYIGDRRLTDRPTTDRPRILANFERPYLGNGSSDPFHLWF